MSAVVREFMCLSVLAFVDDCTSVYGLRLHNIVLNTYRLIN